MKENAQHRLVGVPTAIFSGGLIFFHILNHSFQVVVMAFSVAVVINPAKTPRDTFPTATDGATLNRRRGRHSSLFGEGQARRDKTCNARTVLEKESENEKRKYISCTVYFALLPAKESSPVLMLLILTLTSHEGSQYLPIMTFAYPS